MNKPPDDLSLPELTTRPLYGRAILTALILLLATLALVVLVVEFVILPATDADTTPPVAADCGTPSDDQAIYRFVPDESEMRYTIAERLRTSGRENTIQGHTRTLDGFILLDAANPARSRVCEVAVNMASFESNSATRDRVVRLGYFDVLNYPQAVFQSAELRDFPAEPQRGAPVAFVIQGPLTIKGRPVSTTWQVTATLEGDTLRGTAETTLQLSELGVGPVRIPDFVESGDTVNMRFIFLATRATP